jgi:hypothetical protein
MLLRCTTCGERVSARWLLLAMPWSKYTCGRCGAVFAGTFVRLAISSLAVFLLGYVVLGVIKRGTNPALLLPALALVLVVLTLDLPAQLKKLDAAESADDE